MRSIPHDCDHGMGSQSVAPDGRRREDVGRQSISRLTIAKTRAEVQAAFPECRAQRAMMAAAFFHPGTFHAS